MTSSKFQALVLPTSINSMYRTITSLPMNRSAIIFTECSLYPALITVFTLTANPALRAASMPSSTVSGTSLVSPIAWNVSTSTASRDTVTRFRPASARSCAKRASSMPFVVIAISNS